MITGSSPSWNFASRGTAAGLGHQLAKPGEHHEENRAGDGVKKPMVADLATGIHLSSYVMNLTISRPLAIRTSSVCLLLFWPTISHSELHL
jgi:hypothetical protein